MDEGIGNELGVAFPHASQRIEACVLAGVMATLSRNMGSDCQLALDVVLSR